MKVAESIREKLETAFSPEALEVIDESHLHAGHVGAREGGESHFRIKIVAEAFAGLSRVERQRKINACLKEELAGPVHALAMSVMTPEEAR